MADLLGQHLDEVSGCHLAAAVQAVAGSGKAVVLEPI